MSCRPILFLFQRAKTISDLLQLQCLILKTALNQDPFIICYLILSSSSISIRLTRLLFEKLPIVPPLFSWNTIIRSYATSSDPIESVNLFSKLQRIGLVPDHFTFPFVLKACGICSIIHHGEAVHSMVLKMGLASDKYIRNTLLAMYAACNEIALARQVFDEMALRDVASWSSMIAAYVSCNRPLEALMVFRHMKKMNEMPNSITLVSLISACSRLLDIKVGKAIHSYIVIHGLDLNVALGSALLDMYSKCGNIEKAFNMFNSMGEKNVQSWTIMISGLANHGRGQDAIALFTKMKKTGLKPDRISFSAILSAFSHLGLLNEGQKYFDEMIRFYCIRPSMQHYGCLVDMLGRAGMIEDAYKIIRSMPMKPNSVILRSFVGSCRNHDVNLGNGAKNLLLEMEPELGANYVLAANVSSFSGSYNDAADLRIAMEEKHVRKVPGCSWCR